MAAPDELIVIRDHRNRESTRAMIPTEMTMGSMGPATESLFPLPDVQRWPGWPDEWATPLWNGDTNMGRLVSTLWTSIDLNTRQMASFPIYGMKGVDAIPLPEWANNPEPELYSDWVEAAKQMFNTYQSHGEIILWCTGRFAESSGGYPARWVVLNPAMVNVEWVDGQIEYSLGGRQLERRDVCHIKYESFPTNIRGIGPLEWASRSIISAASLERMATEMASRGGIPWGVLKSQRKLNGTEARELQQAWLQGSRSRSGAPAVLSGTLDLQMLQTSPKEMALLEMRVFDETRIAAALGVPAYLVGLPMPDGLTYANANSLLDFHWRTTLRTLAHSVASALSNWLLPRGSRIEFNRDEYVRPNPYERAQTYEIMNRIRDEHDNPAMTVDEIRMAERWVPNTSVDTTEPLGAIP